MGTRHGGTTILAVHFIPTRKYKAVFVLRAKHGIHFQLQHSKDFELRIINPHLLLRLSMPRKWVQLREPLTGGKIINSALVRPINGRNPLSKWIGAPSFSRHLQSRIGLCSILRCFQGSSIHRRSAQMWVWHCWPKPRTHGLTSLMFTWSKAIWVKQPAQPHPKKSATKLQKKIRPTNLKPIPEQSPKHLWWWYSRLSQGEWLPFKKGISWPRLLRSWRFRTSDSSSAIVSPGKLYPFTSLEIFQSSMQSWGFPNTASNFLNPPSIFDDFWRHDE